MFAQGAKCRERGHSTASTERKRIPKTQCVDQFVLSGGASQQDLGTLNKASAGLGLRHFDHTSSPTHFVIVKQT